MVEFDFFNNEKYITKLLFLIEIPNTLLLRQFMHSALFLSSTSFIFPRQKKVIRKLASYYQPLMSKLGEARHFAILFTSFENS